MHLRRSKERDRNRVMAIARKFSGTINLADKKERLSEAIGTDKVVVACHDDDKALGFVYSYLKGAGHHLYKPGRTELLISALCVDPDHHRKGAGKALLSELIESNGHRKITCAVDVSNKAGMSLFQKLGFKISGKTCAFMRDAANEVTASLDTTLLKHIRPFEVTSSESEFEPQEKSFETPSHEMRAVAEVFLNDRKLDPQAKGQDVVKYFEAWFEYVFPRKFPSLSGKVDEERLRTFVERMGGVRLSSIKKAVVGDSLIKELVKTRIPSVDLTNVQDDEPVETLYVIQRKESERDRWSIVSIWESEENAEKDYALNVSAIKDSVKKSGEAGVIKSHLRLVRVPLKIEFWETKSYSAWEAEEEFGIGSDETTASIKRLQAKATALSKKAVNTFADLYNEEVMFDIVREKVTAKPAGRAVISTVSQGESWFEDALKEFDVKDKDELKEISETVAVDFKLSIPEDLQKYNLEFHYEKGYNRFDLVVTWDVDNPVKASLRRLQRKADILEVLPEEAVEPQGVLARPEEGAEPVDAPVGPPQRPFDLIGKTSYPNDEGGFNAIPNIGEEGPNASSKGDVLMRPTGVEGRPQPNPVVVPEIPMAGVPQVELRMTGIDSHPSDADKGLIREVLPVVPATSIPFTAETEQTKNPELQPTILQRPGFEESTRTLNEEGNAPKTVVELNGQQGDIAKAQEGAYLVSDAIPPVNAALQRLQQKKEALSRTDLLTPPGVRDVFRPDVVPKNVKQLGMDKRNLMLVSDEVPDIDVGVAPRSIVEIEKNQNEVTEFGGIMDEAPTGVQNANDLVEQGPDMEDLLLPRAGGEFEPRDVELMQPDPNEEPAPKDFDPKEDETTGHGFNAEELMDKGRKYMEEHPDEFPAVEKTDEDLKDEGPTGESRTELRKKQRGREKGKDKGQGYHQQEQPQPESEGENDFTHHGSKKAGIGDETLYVENRKNSEFYIAFEFDEQGVVTNIDNRWDVDVPNIYNQFMGKQRNAVEFQVYVDRLGPDYYIKNLEILGEPSAQKSRVVSKICEVAPPPNFRLGGSGSSMAFNSEK